MVQSGVFKTAAEYVCARKIGFLQIRSCEVAGFKTRIVQVSFLKHSVGKTHGKNRVAQIRATQIDALKFGAGITFLLRSQVVPEQVLVGLQEI
jgi:hypothetical protein